MGFWRDALVAATAVAPAERILPGDRAVIQWLGHDQTAEAAASLRGRP